MWAWGFPPVPPGLPPPGRRHCLGHGHPVKRTADDVGARGVCGKLGKPRLSRGYFRRGGPLPNRDPFGRYDAARVSDSVPTPDARPKHALYAPISRRAARPPSGLGGGRAAREAEEGRARVEGPVAVQQGEDRRRSSSTTRRASGSTSRPARTASIFDFVMETEGVAFPEAVERLAAMAGVPMPKYSQGGGGARREAQDAARGDGARGEILRGDAGRRAAAPRRAAISPTAASIRRRR